MKKPGKRGASQERRSTSGNSERVQDEPVITKAVEREMQRLESREGVLTPEAVLAAAENNKNSPLRRFFTWDESDAAHKQRLHEARQLIRSVRFVVTSEDVIVKIPKYIRNPEAGGQEQGYVQIAKIRTNQDLSREIVCREFERAASAIARAKRLAGFLDQTDEIDRLIESLDTLRRMAGEARAPGHA